jgi:SNF2 family DNA or RNA helicase
MICVCYSLCLGLGTPVGKRQKIVDEFNNKSYAIPIFLSSSKAGGLGLNLASASKGSMH